MSAPDPIPFLERHLGPNPAEIDRLLAVVGYPSLDGLADAAVPASIRLRQPLAALPEPLPETEALAALRALFARNRPGRSHLGLGYFDCHTPALLQRAVLEHPGWYTAYTPYQAEISQGRLEALLNFQTMVADLTGLDVANASLLDEATAAAEAMTFCLRVAAASQRRAFFVADDCHPQTIAVIRTRAEPLGVDLLVGDPRQFTPTDRLAGALIQYPATDGVIRDYRPLIEATHACGALVVVATDLLALTVLQPPGALGADVAVGSSQRFGVPLGYGGPHAAFFATRAAHQRQMPGRLVGITRDAQGRPALRLALQTREQHIRREKATSNICTAQVLPAVLASMFAVYHGPNGLTGIARRTHRLARRLATGLRRAGFELGDDPFFDTLRVRAAGHGSPAVASPPAALAGVVARAAARQVWLRAYPDGSVGIALDETTGDREVAELLELFDAGPVPPDDGAPPSFGPLARTRPFLTHPVFHQHRTEHEMLRYLHQLQERDLALDTSMIPLGSCTMKLNPTVAMLPLSWPEIARVHPFAPAACAAGYHELFGQLQAWLADITGLPAVSLQPNAGSAGEYAGLLVIRAWHRHRGQPNRSVCLIPVSAHGTNPASAALAGFQVVPVACDRQGNVDLADLRAKAAAHADRLGAAMVTYPSTHGVFEDGIRDLCEIIHDHGGQVYLDGANMNAQVGLCRPGDFGADVCHLNLHKTFCIPHGGGGPGMGPIAVAAHLAPFLPGHPFAPAGAGRGDGPAPTGPVAAAPWGSASILPISWMYLRLMGAAGLTRASQVALLNANYIARRLDPYFPVLYKGRHGLVAHECILDLRPWKTKTGIEVEDVAKRLMDYGFHAPTMSWPVPGTLMVEPTESESPAELDRFCDALIAIHGELEAIAAGRLDRENNPLKHAPHTAFVIAADSWDHPYSREQAVFPAPWTRHHKFWPVVGRVDNVYGDRHPACTCGSVEDWANGGAG